MTSEWRRMRIGDIGRVITGKTPPTSNSANFDGPYPFITIPDLSQGREVRKTERSISENGANSLRSCLLPANAVLMSCIATIGRCGITTRPSFTNQQINSVICGPDVLPSYLYYVFTQLGGELEAAGGGGSVYTNVSKSRFSDIEIPVPNILEQSAISDFLGMLDDRITLLRETNQTLEAIAQAIFKSWFVDFDPVRAKSQGLEPEGMDADTAELFPDAFEETELGLVPRGWVISRLIDFAKLKGGRLLSKEHFSADGEFPVYGGAGEMGRSNLSNAEGFVITVGRVGAYCGQYFWHSGKAWVNNNASHIIPHNVNYSVWLYQWLRSVDMDLIKKGAAQPFVSNGDIENLQIILPAASVIEEFVSVCEPLFERMSSVLASISTLTNLRDTLLPRLISGQLQLPDAEQEIEKATI